jgi:hypothetical protein
VLSLLFGAGRQAPPTLRTLDAVHLTTAQSVVGVAAFVGDDPRLQSAAVAAGLIALSPGFEESP